MIRIPSTSARAVTSGALAAAVLVASAPAGAAILNDRLSREPSSFTFGTGTARLDGMGLTIAAPDENNEINSLDYGDNPAGLLADRDAWSVDARYSHEERIDKEVELPGNDFLGNTWSLLAAFRSNGVRAIGLAVDYLDGEVGVGNDAQYKYKQTQYRLIYNQMFGRLAAGLEFRYLEETEDQTAGSLFYGIEHDSNVAMGVAGLEYRFNPWISLSARGSLERSNITGLASGDEFHDTFDWERPAGGLEGQLFVDRERLHGAAIYGKSNGAGEETISAEWSPLFEYNPGPYFVQFETETFTEDFDVNPFRTRWEYELIPARARVAASYNSSGIDYATVANPIVIGSRDERLLTDDRDHFTLGGSATLMNDRLLLGAQYARLKNTLEDLDPLTGYTEETTIGQFNVGGEVIATDNLALRGGLGFRTIENQDVVGDTPDPDYEPRRQGSNGETLLSLGAGWVPRGGTLQVDAAYTGRLASDIDLKENHVSLSARILF